MLGSRERRVSQQLCVSPCLSTPLCLKRVTSPLSAVNPKAPNFPRVAASSTQEHSPPPSRLKTTQTDQKRPLTATENATGLATGRSGLCSYRECMASPRDLSLSNWSLLRGYRSRAANRHIDHAVSAIESRQRRRIASGRRLRRTPSRRADFQPQKVRRTDLSQGS